MNGLKRYHLLAVVFFAIAAAIIYLFYRLLSPFFAPLMWATVFAILFYSFYQRTLTKIGKPGIASFLTCVMIVVLIIGPLILLSVSLVEQAMAAVERITELRESGELNQFWARQAPWWNAIRDRLAPYVDVSRLNLQGLIEDAIGRIGGLIVNQSTWLITNISKIAFFFVLMLFTLYYFFKDGHKIMGHIRRLIPLPIDKTNQMLGELREVINATMVSGIVIALIQGFLGGLMFWLVGIPSALFWGAIMAFLSVIPLLGAFIIYIPAGLILFFTGSPIKGIIILTFGSVIVSQVDNFLRPLMVASGTRMHPLMLFLAITGGIALFGLVGIVVGPLIAAAFVTIIEVFESDLGLGDPIIVEPTAAVTPPSLEDEKKPS